MMRFYRLLCLATRSAWNSHRFETITFRLWAYFLLLTGIVAPFGQHRWCLKRVFDEWGGGWVLFPLCAVAALFFYCQFGIKWAIVPYWILWIIDALFIPSLTLRGEK